MINLTIKDFKRKLLNNNKADHLFDYAICSATLIASIILLYKGLVIKPNNAIVLLTFGPILLVSAVWGLFALSKKYEVISIPTPFDKTRNIEIIGIVQTHFSEKISETCVDHSTFWIHGGLKKLTYIVDICASEQEILYNVRLQRGFLDFGYVRKKEKEIEELIRSMS